MRSVFPGRPETADVVLAGVIAVVALGDVFLSGDWRGPTAVNAVVLPALALSLAWRRRAPLAVLGVVAAGLVGLSLAYGGSQAWTAIFVTVVAVYSAAAYAQSVVATVALTVITVVVRDVQDPQIHDFGDAVFSSSLMGLSFLAGLMGRRLNLRAAEVQRRTDELETEQQRAADEARVEERRRIARELHDIVSHGLGVMMLQAGAAEQALERNPGRAREALRAISTTGQEAIDEMGMMLGLIRDEQRTDLAPQPSVADIAPLVERTRQSGLEVDLRFEGPERSLPPPVALSVFRVVQEALTNVLKHAAAGRVEVVVRYRDAAVEVRVSDDGGSHPAGGSGGGRGLAGIRERVAVFGGEFSAGPTENGGWLLRAVLPTVTR